MTYSTSHKQPDAVIKTPFSEIKIYAQYEADPEKIKMAQEDLDRALRYIAKKGGWIDLLKKRNNTIKQLKDIIACHQVETY